MNGYPSFYPRIALVAPSPGDKPLSEPMIVRLPTHICVTRPQWVNNCVLFCRLVWFCICSYFTTLANSMDMLIRNTTVTNDHVLQWINSISYSVINLALKTNSWLQQHHFLRRYVLPYRTSMENNSFEGNSNSFNPWKCTTWSVLQYIYHCCYKDNTAMRPSYLYDGIHILVRQHLYPDGLWTLVHWFAISGDPAYMVALVL